MLTGRDIVLIASVDWEPLWQSHHEIATGLADRGNRVLFIENTGIRAPTVADGPRLAKRLRGWSGSFLRSPREVRPNLWVHSPIVLPPFGPPGIRTLNRTLLLPTIARVTRRLGFADPIVFTWLPSDTALDLTRQLLGPRSLLIYFNIGDFDSLVRRPEKLARAEQELLRKCDLVFAYQEASKRRCEQFARRVELLPPSVNLTRFFLAPTKNRPSERPVVGYIGGLHRFLDLDLIAECARKRPTWDWRLIGPLLTDVSALEGLPNLQFDGARDHAELPGLVASFDIGVVPYRVAPDTESLAPTKINEYLAVGKPAVATEIPWVRNFQRQHGVLEVSPDSADDFIAACERALDSSIDPDGAIRRRQVAEMFGWENQLEWISAVIDELVREKDAGRS